MHWLVFPLRHRFHMVPPNCENSHICTGYGASQEEGWSHLITSTCMIGFNKESSDSEYDCEEIRIAKVIDLGIDKAATILTVLVIPELFFTGPTSCFTRQSTVSFGSFFRPTTFGENRLPSYPRILMVHRRFPL